MGDFNDKQLAFLIDLAHELKLEFSDYHISVSEMIVKNFNKDSLLEKLKEEFSKKVQKGTHKKERLFDDGFEVIDLGPGTTISVGFTKQTVIKREAIVTTLKLKAELFLSFLLNKEEKQKLIEGIHSNYTDEPYKKETTYTDKELLELLEWVC